MTAETPDPGIPESDKPFALVMIGTVTIVGVGAYAVVTGKWDQAKEFVTIMVALVGPAWGYYFGKNGKKV